MNEFRYGHVFAVWLHIRNLVFMHMCPLCARKSLNYQTVHWMCGWYLCLCCSCNQGLQSSMRQINASIDAVYAKHLVLDLDTIAPCVAGPNDVKRISYLVMNKGFYVWYRIMKLMFYLRSCSRCWCFAIETHRDSKGIYCLVCQQSCVGSSSGMHIYSNNIFGCI